MSSSWLSKRGNLFFSRPSNSCVEFVERSRAAAGKVGKEVRCLPQGKKSRVFVHGLSSMELSFELNRIFHSFVSAEFLLNSTVWRLEFPSVVSGFFHRIFHSQASPTG
jgi:hypothetical protein